MFETLSSNTESCPGVHRTGDTGLDDRSTRRKPNIAIDGPAGAGKTTIARLAARRLGFTYVSTGSLYRAITLGLLRRGIDIASFEQTPGQSLVLKTIQISLGYESGEPRVYLDGEDVTDRLSDPGVTEWVSEVARIPAVRTFLLDLQRSCAQGGGVVMDGRDIGTVVLPDAEYKFFLTASVEERTRRRALELSTKGLEVAEEEIRHIIEKRDRIDSTRSVAPLCIAEGAIEIDTSGKSIDQVLEELLSYVAEPHPS
jgi:cytidylate kinase